MLLLGGGPNLAQMNLLGASVGEVAASKASRLLLQGVGWSIAFACWSLPLVNF